MTEWNGRASGEPGQVSEPPEVDEDASTFPPGLLPARPMASTPREPFPSAEPQSEPRESPEARMAALRDELSAIAAESPSSEADQDGPATQEEPDTESKAERAKEALLYCELGRIFELELNNDAKAAKEYLKAFTCDPTFRVPLFSLIRIFERRQSFQNLARLYKAEAKSANDPTQRASALIDAGVLHDDRLQEPDAAKAFFEEALKLYPPELAGALMLELYARRVGDEETLDSALMHRAEHAEHASVRALLLTEIAERKERGGDVDGAFELLRRAAEEPAVRWRTLERMEALGRREGRTGELVQALEGRGALARAILMGEDRGQDSGLVSFERLENLEQMARLGAELYYEAARLRTEFHNDAAGAVRALQQATKCAANDVFLLQELMRSHERAGDLSAAAEIASSLTEHPAYQPETAQRALAALHFRQAELAQQQSDAEGAKRALVAAVQADPDSAAANTMLEDLLIDLGETEALVSRLESKAERSKGALSAITYWQAGQILADKFEDAERAARCYELAIDHAADKPPILRELLGFATLVKNTSVAASAVQRLLDADAGLDPDERSAILRERIQLIIDSPEGNDSTLQDAISAALQDPSAVAWAPHAARWHAARHGDHKLLAQSHERLAEQARENEQSAAHWCAAARAFLRLDDGEGAIRVLRNALGLVPGQPYALSLLEDVLQSRGEANELVSLLRDSAQSQAGGSDDGQALLWAGAAAEASGDEDLAADTYDEAAKQHPHLRAPWLALRRIAKLRSDPTQLQRACEGLAECELAADEGGMASLDLAELYDFVVEDVAKAEVSYQAALPHPQIGEAAAVGLLALPGKGVSQEARLEALERLALNARESDLLDFERTVGMEAAANEFDVQRALRAAEQVLSRDPRNLWANWARLIHAPKSENESIASADEESPRAINRADLWLNLAGSTQSLSAASELSLLALRAKLVSGEPDAADDAFLIAQDIAAATPEEASAGIGLDEALSVFDDPEARVEALQARRAHVVTQEDHASDAELARTLLAAGRASEAVLLTRKTLEACPDDLATWETLRVAARADGQFDYVVTACEKLANFVEGPLRAQLLEEAAAVCMDELHDDERADPLLRAALDADSDCKNAFGRLHDLLVESSDDEGLLELLRTRADTADNDETLEKLHYEEARVLRSQGELQRAMDAVERLLELNTVHVGGLALKVEILVAQEAWDGAVRSLVALANADVPADQKRISRLGAADFLEHKLDDPAEAVSQIEAVVELGYKEPGLYARIAALSERLGRFREAAAAFIEAAEHDFGANVTTFLQRAGALLRDKTGDTKEAADVFFRAHQNDHGNVASVEALNGLFSQDDPRRAVVLGAFEAAARRDLEASPLEPLALRKLQRAAFFAGDVLLEQAALHALVSCLKVGDGSLVKRAQELERHVRDLPVGGLDDVLLSTLRASGASATASNFLRMTNDVLAVIDRNELSKYGVNKGHLVSEKQSHPFRGALARLCAGFGLSEFDLYVGGPNAQQTTFFLGRRGKPTWVIGNAVAAGEWSPRDRFAAGRLALAYREGVLSFAMRGPEEIATILFACAAALGAPVSRDQNRRDMEDWSRLLGKKMPRKTRRGLTELSKQLSGQKDLESAAEATSLTLLRGGLLASSSLEAGLFAAHADDSDLVDAAKHQPARDLASFWLSQKAARLRRSLGLFMEQTAPDGPSASGGGEDQ